LRVEPRRDFLDVRAFVGAEARARSPRARPHRLGGALAWLALVPPVFVALATADAASAPVRRVAGFLAAGLLVLLALHSVLKRVRGVRATVLRLLQRLAPARGLVVPVRLHAGASVLAACAVLVHAGTRPVAGVAGVLLWGFWLLFASGLVGGALYALLPRRLARITREGALPEDRDAQRLELERALFQALSGKNDAVQVLARVVLLPYAARPFGSLLLLLSGRSRREEEAGLRKGVERLLGGRPSARLEEATPLLSAAVALRALGAERLGEALLRSFVPVHLSLSTSVILLLGLHVLGALP
jgi:hypothetical protein